MRILLLSQWYPPEPQKVVSDVAEDLIAQGHEVFVLTGLPNFPSGKIYDGYRVRLFQREELNGVPVLRVPLYPDHGRSPIKRALNILSFAFFAALLGPFVVPRVDAIHVIHPPPTVAIPARLIACLRRIPVTYEIQDMWPETLRATGLVNSERILRCIGWFMKRVFKRVDAIRVISPGFRDNLIDKGVPDGKIRVISNWVDSDWYRPVPPDPEFLQEHGMENRFNIMYAGSMGTVQALDVVLDAAEQLKDELPDVQFIMVGGGTDADRLVAEARGRGLDNVLFPGWFAQEEMVPLHACADAFLVHLKDDPLFRITIPHKIFGYMACQKPVIAAVQGDAADVVVRAQAGLACPPCNPNRLADAVRELYSMTPDERARLGRNGREAAVAQYSRPYLVGKIAAMLEEVVQQRGKGRRRPR